MKIDIVDENDARVVLAMVGTTMRLVSLPVLLDVSADLADEYRAKGLQGDELDRAIVNAMPARLSEVLDGETERTIH